MPRVCPNCDSNELVRASLFSPTHFTRANPEAAAEAAVGVGVDDTHADEQETWLESARALIDEPGEYLAYEEDGEVKLVALTREWTRVGRSLAADIRFDDPTVSRRHALIVRQADGVRVLDDRSLNGVFVNGERVEWRVLSNRDEIVVGRHRLRFLSDSITAATAEPGAELQITT
jgi:pSer/pThr/pTyr-binding forkhead associated (FHA) protein